MEFIKSPLVKAARGRPPSNRRRQVVDQLISATETLLRTRSHLDLTEKEISLATGVSESMIHYYFRDKDGLLFAVVSAQCDRVMERLGALDHIDTTSPSVTREIVSIVSDAYHYQPWIGKIMVSELARTGSGMREPFVRKYGRHGMGLVRLRQVFKRLVEGGVYDSNADIEHASTCMFSIITAPLMFFPLTQDSDITLENPDREAWINYVAQLFDHQLRKSAR